MLSTLSIRALSILFIVVLNAQFDDANLPAMSGSDACFVFSIMFFIFFPFSIHYNSFTFWLPDMLCCSSGFSTLALDLVVFFTHYSLLQEFVTPCICLSVSLILGVTLCPVSAPLLLIKMVVDFSICSMFTCF